MLGVSGTPCHRNNPGTEGGTLTAGQGETAVCWEGGDGGEKARTTTPSDDPPGKLQVQPSPS